ncbi:nucleotidyltransferase family protein [Streptomyces sp. NPDC059627]
MTSGTGKVHFSLAAVGAGLISTAHHGAQEYGLRLIGQCDTSLIADRAVEFINFLKLKKCLAFMPGVREHFDDTRFNELWQLCEALDHITEKRIEILLPAFTALRQAGMEVMPIKGFDMIYSFPNASGKRFVVDADPLVRPGDMEKAHRILVDAGFRQGEISRSRLDAAGTAPELTPLEARDLDWMLQNHHQAHPYFKFFSPEWLREHADLLKRYTPTVVIEGQPYVAAAVDLHFSIASGFEEEDQWPSRRRITLPDGLEYPALDPEVYLCLYLGRAYSVTQAFNDPPLQAIADAARVVANCEMDWSRFTSLVDKYRLYAPAYYGLAQLSEILQDDRCLPSEQVEHFYDLLQGHPDYDLGDFSARFLSTAISTPFAQVFRSRA